jgi:hypothetical protein
LFIWTKCSILECSSYTLKRVTTTKRVVSTFVDDDKGPDCWICYDPDRSDAGPMIHPCDCRGDVGAVHHDCLRRWLVEVRFEKIYFYHYCLTAITVDSNDITAQVSRNFFRCPGPLVKSIFCTVILQNIFNFCRARIIRTH